MQDGSTAGLATAAAEKRRYTIVPLHNAQQGDVSRLVDLWKGKGATEAHGTLAEPDVQVTNKSDKDRQLPKILKLNETTMQALDVQRTREAALEKLGKAMAAKDESELTAALAAAEAAQLAPANLQTAKEAVEAAQQSRLARQKVLEAFKEAELAFARAQQAAKDIGSHVTLKKSGSTLTVKVTTRSDGKANSLDLEQAACLQLATDLEEGGPAQPVASTLRPEPITNGAPQSSACIIL